VTGPMARSASGVGWPNPRAVVAGVEGVPAPAQPNLEPSTEIHRVGHGRHADVTKVACAVARRDVHAPAEGDRQVGEVAADAGAVEEATVGRA
jgi:hypothetical protein